MSVQQKRPATFSRSWFAILMIALSVLLIGTPALAQEEGDETETPTEEADTDEAADEEETGEAVTEEAGDEAAGDEAAEDDAAEDEAAGEGTSAAGQEAGETGDVNAGEAGDGTGDSEAVPDADVRALTNQRLREIGSRVDALKEDTFATKSRLLLLRESVLGGTIAGSNLIVVHQNEMGGEYELVQILYALDGEKMFSKRDFDDGLDRYDGDEVINEPIVPGSRSLGVQMVFKGNNWGIFRYMDGYTFTVSGSHQFTAEEGKAHTLIVRAVEGGNFFTPYEERPTFEFDMESTAIESAKK